MSRRNILFTQPIECSVCHIEKMFFGEDATGDKRQAKINAFVSAAQAGWWVDYMPDNHMCPECRNDQKNQNFFV